MVSQFKLWYRPVATLPAVTMHATSDITGSIAVGKSWHWSSYFSLGKTRGAERQQHWGGDQVERAPWHAADVACGDSRRET